jgi:hypothetical protein
LKEIFRKGESGGGCILNGITLYQEAYLELEILVTVFQPVRSVIDSNATDSLKIYRKLKRG